VDNLPAPRIRPEIIQEKTLMQARHLLSFFVVTAMLPCVGCGDGAGSEDAVDHGLIDISGADTADEVTADHGSDYGRDSAADAIVAPDVADIGEPVDAVDDPGFGDAPPEICRNPVKWDPSNALVKVFSDVTDQSGLLSQKVRGIRAGTVDFDGDGLPDLVTRNVSQARDAFEGSGPRFTWLLRNKGGFEFEDVTESSGFTATRDVEGTQGRVTHVVVWGDVDNDGDLDAFSGRSMTSKPTGASDNMDDRAELLLNNGDGTFSLAAEQPFRWVTRDPKLAENLQMYDPNLAASFLDYNRDGSLDLFLGYAMYGQAFVQDMLFAGDGTGAFSDVTEEAGLKLKVPLAYPYTADPAYKNGTAVRNTWGTTVTDINNDGWPDIMCSVYGRYFNALWLGGPEGFSDWSHESGYASDHREDWTTNLNARCYCKLVREVPQYSGYPAEGCEGVQDPPETFRCVNPDELRWNHNTDRNPYRLGGNTFSTVSGDIDNDGDMDLFTFEIVHWDVGDTSDPAELLVNDGSPKPIFSRPGAGALGMARDWDGHGDFNAGDMTGALFDFDNDGRLDVLIASSDYPYTRAFLFHQKDDGTFEEVPAGVGIDQPHAHGVAVADFDLDGDLDVVLGHSTARCDSSPDECYSENAGFGKITYVQQFHAFRNEIGQSGNWTRINLIGGAGSNRAAIGAVVKVTAGGVTRMREVGGGHGHVGIQHEMTQHFGLGSSCNIDRIEVRWPDAAGTVEVFRNVRGNYVVDIEQGAGAVRYHLPE